MESYEKTFNNVCRLCLRYDESNKNTSLVDSNRESGLSVYGESVIKLTNSDIDINDKLPKKICFGCKNELRRIECFKSMCKTNCDRLNSLVNENYKSSSDDAKIEAAIQYSMFTQYFPDRYQEFYLKMVLQDFPLNGVKEESQVEPIQSYKDNVRPKVEVEIKCNATVVPIIKKEFDCSDTNNFSDDDESQNAPIGDESQSKTKTLNSFLDQIEDIFGKTKPKQKQHSKPNNLSDIESCEAPMEVKSQSKTEALDQIKASTKQKKQFICNICNKKLAYKCSYKVHMQSHEQYQFICDQCGRGFSTKLNMNKHRVARHGVASSYECNSCSYRTSCKFELIEHIRLHTGERPFTCEKCGLTFRRRAIYAKHLKCHDEKKIICPKCPKKFYQLSQMKAHMNSVHERIYLYLCHICNTSYARTVSVRKHLVSKHGIAREIQGKIVRVTKNTHGALFKENKG